MEFYHLDRSTQSAQQQGRNGTYSVPSGNGNGNGNDTNTNRRHNRTTKMTRTTLILNWVKLCIGPNGSVEMRAHKYVKFHHM